MRDRDPAESMVTPGGTHRRPVRLQARGITKTYGGRRVLADVDLVVHAGEAVAVVGANGSGQSRRC